MLILDGHGSHIDLEFLWTCKLHNVELLFLPSHSSYVLQPLDLSVFSVVKKFYRQQIQALPFLDDAAPVKKERFITAYHKARENGITERIVRAGWAAAGICPLNIDRVVNSSQISRRPITPPRSNQLQLPVESFLSTPQGPPAGLEAENKRLHSQVESLAPKRPRKRVQIEPNQRFADIETIMVAVQASTLLEAQNNSEAAEKAAERAAAEAAAQTLQSMCTE
ncbi:DDE-domain-containing protein [Lentithecium fluviatile CBS 122367]|uniref:DDE-domain-containing protein n=1 Tax=Lentithecium fluviatile CBS 122367 TaxID=1168545 RepID=A0A6G1IVA1_9PLEO|nr:DDE-domain-containing protein [Lentithecium fluviatile CBS 122367]